MRLQPRSHPPVASSARLTHVSPTNCLSSFSGTNACWRTFPMSSSSQNMKSGLEGLPGYRVAFIPPKNDQHQKLTQLVPAIKRNEKFCKKAKGTTEPNSLDDSRNHRAVTSEKKTPSTYQIQQKRMCSDVQEGWENLN